MPSRRPFLTAAGITLLFVLPSSPLFAQGAQWRRVNVGSAGLYMATVYAYDTLNIWTSNYFGDVIFTKNGGLNWSHFSLDNCCLPLSGGHAYSFFFFDTSAGWMSGMAFNTGARSFRLKTTDGGESWVTQLDSGSLYGGPLLFLNRRRGFNLIGNACSFKDSFLVSDDSGKSWQRQPTGIPACDVESFFFVDSLNGWGISSHPAPNNTGVDLIRTWNGGSTWTVVPTSIPICAGAKIFFVDTLIGWMWHCSPIIPNEYRFSRTQNGGITWDSLAGFGSSFWFNAFDAADTNHFWLAGYNGFYASMQFSSDGGRSWAEQMPGVGDEIVSVDAVDCRHAYAAGVNGYLYFYTPDSTAQIGDLNQDGTLSTADAVLMLNYTFLGVPNCVSPDDMDFNNDCSVTAADVVMLLTKVFVGGPPLQAGCAGP